MQSTMNFDNLISFFIFSNLNSRRVSIKGFQIYQID
jgi:hypothetical protein